MFLTGVEISFFFAQFYGGLYVLLGLLSLGPSFLGRTIERTNEPLFTVSTGYVSLVLGLATVILHTVWTLDWRIVVTLLGWATLAKGILKTGFPEFIQKQAQQFKRKQKLESFFIFLLGIWLLWMGFSS